MNFTSTMFPFNYYSSDPNAQEEDQAATYNDQLIIPPPPEFQENYSPDPYFSPNMNYGFLNDDQLQMRTVSPAFSDGSYRYDPTSPGFIPSVSQSNSPVPMSSMPFAPVALPPPLPTYNPYVDRPPSPYSTISSISPALSMFSSATSANNFHMDGRLSSLSTDTQRSHISAASDSGVSTLIDEAFVVEPPELTEELRVHPQLMERYNKEYDTLMCRTMLMKTRYMREHVEEITEQAVVTGVKRPRSALRKEYQTPEQMAERERNNEASRRSRNKKKLLDKKIQVESEFQRISNTQMIELRKYMGGVIYTLEEKLLELGINKNEIQKQRATCGVPFYDPKAAFEAMIPQ